MARTIAFVLMAISLVVSLLAKQCKWKPEFFHDLKNMFLWKPTGNSEFHCMHTKTLKEIRYTHRNYVFSSIYTTTQGQSKQSGNFLSYWIIRKTLPPPHHHSHAGHVWLAFSSGSRTSSTQTPAKRVQNEQLHHRSRTWRPKQLPQRKQTHENVTPSGSASPLLPCPQVDAPGPTPVPGLGHPALSP
jgi:hypothetical protein